MRAQILSIGSELMLGHLTDTNATYLAQQLAGLGIELTLVTQVGDDLLRLTAAVADAMADADITICTGGVGPTADDLTREAIAAVFGEEPEVQPEVVNGIRAFFAARGLEMPERNVKQAWLIPSAVALPNPVGTAPGWYAERDGHAIAAMPGVPREMFRMWREQVVPRLLARGGGLAISSVTLKTIGIGESAAEQRLADLVAIANPIVATYAKDDGVHIRITATDPASEVADRIRDTTAAEIRTRLAAHIYGEDDQTLPGQLRTALETEADQLSIVDAGGGGRFASLIANDPTADRVLLAATLVSPSPDHDAGSMAAAAAKMRGATLGIGILVSVEPRTNAVYEGTIAVAVAGRATATETLPMKSGYEDIQRRSALVAADLLRRVLN